MLRHYALLSDKNVVIATLSMDDQRKGLRPAHFPHVEIGKTRVAVGMTYDPEENALYEQPILVHTIHTEINDEPQVIEPPEEPVVTQQVIENIPEPPTLPVIENITQPEQLPVIEIKKKRPMLSWWIK